MLRTSVCVKRAAKVQLVSFYPNFIFDFFKNLRVDKNLFSQTGCKDNISAFILPNLFADFFKNSDVFTLSQNVPSFTGLQMYHDNPFMQAFPTIIWCIST